MIETGRVIAIADDFVTVACLDTNCAHCHSSFCNPKQRTLRAAKPPLLAVAIDDVVEVSMPTARAIGAGFLVLIMPLLLFIGAYVTFDRLVPGVSEPVKVLVGLAGLLAGFGLTLLIGRRTTAGDLPQVTSVVPPPAGGSGVLRT